MAGFYPCWRMIRWIAFGMTKLLRISWASALALLVLTGCERHEKPAPPAPQKEVGAILDEQPAIEEAPIPAPEPEVEPQPAPAPRVAPVDRAQALGFARHIPADAEVLVSFHQGKSAIEGIQRMKLWSAFDSDLANPFRAESPDDFDRGGLDDFEDPGEFDDLQGLLEEEDQFAPTPTLSPLDFFGTEVTLAFGPQSAGRVAGFLDFNRRSTYHQMRAMAAAMAADKGDDSGDALMGGIGSLLFGMGMDMYGDLLTDRAAREALDAFQMPSIYFAVRASEENLAAAHELVSGPVQFLSMFGEAVAPAEIEHAGVTFRGFRLIGSDIAGMMEEDRESMEEYFGAEAVRNLIEFITAREVVAVSGILDDYAVAFFGASLEDFKLSPTPEESLAGSSKLAFVDAHLDHPLHGILYSAKGFTESVSNSIGGFADYAEGLGDGLATHDRDGGNRDLVALLQLVSDRERALLSLATHETTGMTIVNDHGLRIDMHGGLSGALDFTSPARFARLGDAPDTAIFVNFSSDPLYQERSRAYQEALFQAAHTLMMRVFDKTANETLPDPDDEYAPFVYDPFAGVRDTAAMIESGFRSNIVNLWQAVAHDMRSGLGNETAIVVDLKGTMPEIPDVPKALLENNRAPRVTMLAPVVRRESLASAWETIQENSTQIVERIAEMRESEIPMPKPIQSTSDGLTSWFMPLPWFNDEFLPSVTLDDRWFALGTSRNHGIDLINRLDALEPTPGGGLRIDVNFRLLAEYQRAEMANFTAKRDAILETDEIDDEEFDELLTSMEGFARALEEFENLEIRCWEEGGTAHTRVHLRLRK